MADWAKIESEYITTNASYRDLAQKYGVDKDSVGRHGKADNWPEKRRQYKDKLRTKVVSVCSQNKINRVTRLRDLSDKLLDKVAQLLSESDEIYADTAAMKDVARILKDVKDIQMLKTDLDIEEQKARIATLRKQAKDTSLPDGAKYGVVLMPHKIEITPPTDGDADG